ncbi:MAG: transporter substrate-binding protein [Betaproteobacteria bacterium]|nr:transporter substrate-binding protein [Betaproteobacteria bacterium]
MHRRTLVKTLAALAATLASFAFGGGAHAAWPDRPVTLIVPWGAGGGTDGTARIIGSLLEKDLGQPVNVINRTGGNGVVGHNAISTAAPDGYTIGMVTVELVMMHWAGLTQMTYKDFNPIGLVNIDASGITVKADSPYKNLGDLVSAIKAAPAGKMKASGTGQGGIWQLALAGMLKDLKMNPQAVGWVPSNGAAPAMTDLVAGGVDVVPVSLPEARALIDAGKARPLAIMSKEPSALYPNVPTLKSLTGSDWTMGAWRGIATPKGIPPEVQTKLAAALKKIYDSKEYKDFMGQRGFGLMYADPKGFGDFMAKSDADMGVIMKTLGLSK